MTREQLAISEIMGLLHDSMSDADMDDSNFDIAYVEACLNDILEDHREGTKEDAWEEAIELFKSLGIKLIDEIETATNTAMEHLQDNY